MIEGVAIVSFLVGLAVGAIIARQEDSGKHR